MKAETLQQEIREIDHELNRKNYNSPFQLRVYRKLRAKKAKQLKEVQTQNVASQQTPQLKLL